MRKSLHLRSLHLVTQTIKLIDDLADQILIPVAALEEVMVNDPFQSHTGLRVHGKNEPIPCSGCLETSSHAPSVVGYLMPTT